MLHGTFDAHLMVSMPGLWSCRMCIGKGFVTLSVIGLAIAAMQASTAVAAARNSGGGCGAYRYYRGGKCVDARGSDAGPPDHWHPHDPSNSRSGGV
jgi:uncharacterized membrane protein